MVIWRINLTVFFFLFFAQIWAQPSWPDLVPPAFERVKKEINRHVLVRRVTCDSIRAMMDTIINSRNLNRELIFGAEDKYFKEGMSKSFSKAPQPLLVSMDRDPKIVRLESLHVELYQNDLALLRMLEFQTKLSKHPDLIYPDRWASRWNKLSDDERFLLQDGGEVINWLVKEITCDLVSDPQWPDPKKRDKEISQFEPKFLLQKDKKNAEASINLTFPFSADNIVASYPMNGQFAMFKSAESPKIGYLMLKGQTRPLISELMSNGMVFMARWTNAEGGFKYTSAEYRLMEGQFFFKLPEYFEREVIYRLELIALPNDYKPLKPESATCWQILNGEPMPISEIQTSEKSGEIAITELYFRAGKYNVFEKRNTMAGTLNWALGALVYITDEPFDPTEMKGTPFIPACVSLFIQNYANYGLDKALNSNVLYYYLTVPKVNSLENVPIDQLVSAELDNTLDAPFMQHVEQGNPDDYLQIQEQRDKDRKLPGNYVVPTHNSYTVVDSLVTETPVPFITKADFLNKKRMVFQPTRCTLYIGEFQQLVALVALQEKQLKRRIEERAQFFYALEKRRAQRAGKPLNLTFEQVRKREIAQLPPDVKMLMDKNLPEIFLKGLTVFYTSKLPGTDQYSAQLEIKLDKK